MTARWSDMSRDQRIEAVRTLRADKLSFDAIAARLHATRNAVAGIVHRHADDLKSNYGDQRRAPRKRAEKRAPAVTPSIVTPIAAARGVPNPLGHRREKTTKAWEDRGPVPSAVNPIPFAKTEGNVCLCFLPGEPNTSTGLVCANPVSPGRHNKVCDSCAEWFYSAAALVVIKRRAVA